MISDPESFTIIKSLWSRGLGVKTKILDDSGKMDCIGFLLKASLVSDKVLNNADEPIDIINQIEWFTKLIEWHGSAYMQSQVCSNIIQTNDNQHIDDSDREILLIKYFKLLNINLTFID